MNKEIPENDALWRLLGHARKPSAYPFFARNVLRTIRESSEKKTFLSGFWVRWISVAATACLTIGFTLSLAKQSAPLNANAIEIFDQAAGLNDLSQVPEITIQSFLIADSKSY